MNRIRMPLFILLTLVALPCLFAETGDEILARVEAALTGPKDYEGRATMVLANTDGSAREQREIRVWFAGKDKSMIKFTAPAGIEGISLLSDGDKAMYLYLPAQNKIRMIEGSLKNEDFQGTDFSYNEMSSYQYRDDYAATVAAEDASSWTLNLTRKAGSDRTYDRAVMVVDKETAVPKKIELYSGNALKKVLRILETKKSGPYLIPVRVRMDNAVKGHYTEMTLADVKFDQGLEAQGVFTKRFLKKPVSR
jgi:outer membrane lipoprotein-sorting protein